MIPIYVHKVGDTIAVLARSPKGDIILAWLTRKLEVGLAKLPIKPTRQQFVGMAIYIAAIATFDPVFSRDDIQVERAMRAAVVDMFKDSVFDGLQTYTNPSA